MEYCILDGVDEGLAPENLYFIISEIDLINTIKISKKNNLQIGNDIAIISLYDKPYKEILEGGITSIDYNYKKIGEEIASLISDNKTGHFRAYAKFKIRKSV